MARCQQQKRQSGDSGQEAPATASVSDPPTTASSTRRGAPLEASRGSSSERSRVKEGCPWRARVLLALKRYAGVGGQRREVAPACPAPGGDAVQSAIAGVAALTAAATRRASSARASSPGLNCRRHVERLRQISTRQASNLSTADSASASKTPRGPVGRAGGRGSTPHHFACRTRRMRRRRQARVRAAAAGFGPRRAALPAALAIPRAMGITAEFAADRATPTFVPSNVVP